jgi:hypothetical protein
MSLFVSYVCIFHFVVIHLCMLQTVEKVPAFALDKSHFKLPTVIGILR